MDIMKKNLRFLILSLIFLVLCSEVQGEILCTHHALVIPVSESSAIGTDVFTPDCTDSNSGTLSYIIASGTPKKASKNKFHMPNSATGTVKIKGELNADFLHKFTLNIKVTSSSGATDTLNIAIKVLDVNDNEPVLKDVVSLSLTEDTPIGTLISSCSANDKDHGANAPAHFTIQNPTSPDASYWFLDRDTCDLYVNRKLDFETKKSFTLTIEAVDLGSPPLSANPLPMTITVLDVNDNYPNCSQYYKVIDLKEDFNVGVRIDGISCSDADSGTNKQITYSLAGTNNVDVTATFAVNPTSGDISLINAVDYETLKTYEVKIDVADAGAPSLTSTVIFGIVISDVDDNIPVWPVNPIQISVSEVAPLGNIVFTVQADDADSPITVASKIYYEMVTPPNPDWFSIDKDTGAVSVKAMMNRLIAPFVTMDVLAYSTDKLHGFNSVTINITIIDENNIAPTFDQVFYQGNVTENDPEGTYILTVAASDPEEGVYGEIEYHLDSSVFQVDPVTGDVSLKAGVDFEVSKVHSLRIEARDKGTPPQSGYAFLLINVLPVNEHDPVIVGPTAAINTLEDTEPGTVLADFDATDADDGRDGVVIFTLQTTLSPFTIEPNTGLFRIATQLDREKQEKWDIVVVATDSSETVPRSSTMTLSVILGDINDNSPVCDPLTTEIIPLDHPINSQLETINCQDADAGVNGEFTFTKISGDSKDAFNINPTTGEITLVKRPTEASYTLTIEIKDKGSPQLSVIIAYNIIAEIEFNFLQLPTTLNKSENTPPNTELITFDTCCVFGLVTYELVSGNEDNHVLLDPSSGKLILRNMFDYETKKSFRYLIRATAITTNTKTEAYLDVNVEDFNDNAPKFATSFQEKDVSEDIDVSASILNIAATDMDSGLNGQIDYTLTGGSPFEVDTDGNLKLKSKLDAETVSQYTLQITATDKGDVPKSSMTTIVINVKNVNEFSPKIINMVDGMVVEQVSEDAALGSPILKLQAVDEDINTILTYSITQGNDEGIFVIDESTGDIYLGNSLDRETTSQYNLTVEVSTQNGEKVSAVVVVNILDVNDNDPRFAKDVYQLEITHNDPDDTLITTFVISDADSGVNKDITSVAIIDGDPNNHFKIDGKKLLTNVKVDYNTDKLYTLTLQATDGGTSPRSGTSRVNVKVLPKYKQPKFFSSSFSVNVREDVIPADIINDMDATADGATEGNTGTISYSIVSGDSDGDFVMSDTTGVIQITSGLDFERIKVYNLIITARSKEDPQLISTATLTLSVENLNDNIPTFNKALYDFTIDEDAVNGDIVGIVTALDGDEAPFNSFTYSLGTSVGSTDFTIDTSGAIKVVKPLSFLSQNVYSIPVIADDVTHKGYSLVVIKVNDVNDHPPVFSPSSFSVDVVESMDVGKTFYTVKAEDVDTGINGQIKYTLVSGNFDNQINLDADSGALIVSSRLDREAHDRFDLIIRAEDKATPALSGTLSLTVHVGDVNDHDPTFTTPNNDITISRSSSPGTTVRTVQATDGDIGDNAFVVYEISQGIDGLFLMDVNSGEIKTAASLLSAENEYNLVVTAKDKGIPPRSSTMIVNIQIIPLKPTTSDQTLQMQEELTAGQSVGVVNPTHTPSASVNYQIIGGNFKNSFQIDPSSGALSTTKRLDREEYPTYILTIRITDSGPVVDYTRTITVTILDINDNSPIITTTDTNINVVENTPAGQIVAGFTVTDLDDGNNSKVSLEISPTPLAAGIYFETDGNLLKIKKVLDFETTTSIIFTILAKDQGNPQRTGSIEVTVTVIDVEDGIEYTEEGEVPSIYMSREASFNSENGEKVTTITPEEYNMNVTMGPTTFKSLNREGIFAVDDNGLVTVQKRELLEPDSKYFVWVVATAENGGAPKSVLGLLRIDTFDPNKHVVSLESSMDIVTLESNRDILEENLKSVFPSDQPKIWKIKGSGGTTRRRLLAASSETLVYVIEGPPRIDISHVESVKTFKDVNSMLSVLRVNPNEDTPKTELSSLNYPIIAVNAYSEPVSDEGQPEESFIASVGGYVTFAMLALLILIIIIIIVVCIYKKKKREKESMNESTEELMPEEPKKQQRKIEITKPIALGLKKSSVKEDKPAKTNETNKTTQKTTLGTSDTSLSLHGKKRGKSVSPSPSSLTPVATPTTPSEILVADESLKTKKEKRLLPIPQKAARKVSTIDPTSGKTDNPTEDDKPVVAKRSNGPVVHRGKEYDGVGFDKDKNQRYAYNTRTGSTLWVEKEKGMGTGPQGRNLVKKKAAPKLTVVGEAPGSNTPNLTLNRSIGMVSSDK